MQGLVTLLCEILPRRQTGAKIDQQTFTAQMEGEVAQINVIVRFAMCPPLAEKATVSSSKTRQSTTQAIPGK
jgi:hypothetical protein